jgi:LysM repeat protein
MLGDESFEVEVDRMKQNLKRFRRENAELKKQLVLYLSICFLVSVFSCSMMIYLIFSNSPHINVIMSEDHGYGKQKNPTDDIIEDVYLDEDEVISSDLDTDELSVGIIDEVENDNFSVEVDDDTPENIENNDVSFGLPTAKDEVFGLPNTNIVKKTMTIKRYIVKKNDNLWNISRKYFGSSRYIQKIKKDNSLISDDLIPGTRLILMIEK